MKIVSAEEFQYHYQVLGTDLDVFGHVNNARYLNIYEMARWDFIESRGFGLKKIQKEKKGPVLLNVNLQFRRELKNLDKIIVNSKAIKIEGKYMTLYQEMMRGEDLCSKAEFLVGFFDMQMRKLLTPSQEWLDTCGVILE